MSADDIATQSILPIIEQEPSRRIAEENARLLNCWLGIAKKENLGSTFCEDCEYLQVCKSLYSYFDSRAVLHPSARARRVLESFDIDSDYL